MHRSRTILYELRNFLSALLFLKFYMLLLAVMHFIEITLERFCMKITLFSGTLFKKADKILVWNDFVNLKLKFDCFLKIMLLSNKK